MAWTEQCKIAFTTTADALYYQQQGKKNKTKIIKQLAEDTDISPRTLRRWWDEDSMAKNGHTEVNIENNNENTDKEEEPLCSNGFYFGWI